MTLKQITASVAILIGSAWTSSPDAHTDTFAAIDRPEPLRSMPERNPAGAREAERILAKAYDALGGRARLYAIEHLEIRQSSTRTLRLFLPEQFQIETKWEEAGTPRFFSFDGTYFRKSDLTRGVAADRSPDASVSRGNRRGTGLWQLTIYTLTYLLRTVPAFPLDLDSKGTQRLDRFEGPTVDFLYPASNKERAGQLCIRIFFDSASGLPTVLAQPARDAPGGPITGQLMTALSDYRMVSGVRFPFRVSIEQLRVDGTRVKNADWKHQGIAITRDSALRRP